MQPKGSVVLDRPSNLWWSMPRPWLQDGVSTRISLINQSTTTAIPQPTTVVLRQRMCPCIKPWPTPTISRQFTFLIKSVFKRELVTVRNLVLTLTMFRKNLEFHLVVVWQPVLFKWLRLMRPLLMVVRWIQLISSLKLKMLVVISLLPIVRSLNVLSASQ